MNDPPRARAVCLPRYPVSIAVMLVFLCAALLVLPVQATSVTRTVVQEPSTGDATVTLAVDGLIDGGVAELLPDGWQFREQGQSGMVRNDGNVVAIRIRNTSSVTYMVTTGGHPEKTISGFWEDYATTANGTVSDAGRAPEPAPVQTARSPGFAGVAAVAAFSVVFCIVLAVRCREDTP